MDKRNLLLISNSTMRGEAYLGWCKDMIADFCRRHNVKKVLFVLTPAFLSPKAA